MKYHMNKSITANFRILFLVMAFMTFQGSVLLGQFSWFISTGGSWSTDTNWTPDPPGQNKGPNAIDDSVLLGSAITAAATISLPNAPRTIGALTFDNSSFNYTLAGAGTLKFDVTTGSAAITVTNGSHVISTNLQTQDATIYTQNSASAFSISGAIATGGLLQTFTGTGNTTASGIISSGGAVTKSGAGTLTFSGVNTYTGATTVNAGTLTLNTSGGTAIAGTAISLNGGTLLLGAANQINDGAALTFNSGTFNTGGVSETVGVLDLSATSIIDFGSGTSVLTFASAGTWTGATDLTINSWTGNLGGGGTDQLIFTATPDGTQLSQIKFLNPAGLDPGTYGSLLIGSEVVPVPEASSMIGAGLLSALIILDILRRRKQRRKELTEAA